MAERGTARAGSVGWRGTGRGGEVWKRDVWAKCGRCGVGRVGRGRVEEWGMEYSTRYGPCGERRCLPHYVPTG